VRPEPPAKDPMPVKDPMPYQESTPVLSRR
jgi:hypothetical protein